MALHSKEMTGLWEIHSLSGCDCAEHTSPRTTFGPSTKPGSWVSCFVGPKQQREAFYNAETTITSSCPFTLLRPNLGLVQLGQWSVRSLNIYTGLQLKLSDKNPKVYIEGNPLLVSCVLYAPIYVPYYSDKEALFNDLHECLSKVQRHSVAVEPGDFNGRTGQESGIHQQNSKRLFELCIQPRVGTYNLAFPA